MNFKQSLILAGVGLVAVASSAIPELGGVANAAPFGTNGSAVKVVNATDPAKFDLYLAGQGATEVSANLLGQTKVTTKVANACGLATFPDSTTTPNSGVAGFAALPVQTIPTCSAAGVLSEPRTANFKTATNQIVKVGTAASSQSITYALTKIKKGTPRAGLLKLSSLSNGTGNDVSIGATNYDLTSVPTVTDKPVTRKNAAGGYDLYVPAGWVP
jgi:hypothetical protein